MNMKFSLQLFVLAALTFVCSGARVQSFVDHKKNTRKGSFNHDKQGDNWNGTCAIGKKQSPIALIDKDSIVRDIPRIQFENYNQTLQPPLVVFNNGHTAYMVITPTVGRQRAYITRGLLPGTFEAHNVHFHWGFNENMGSEHTINSKRYDVEMHIVHKNVRYTNVAEASQHWDGLAVLGVMIRGVYWFTSEYSAIQRIFDQLPKITQYNTAAEVKGPLTAGSVLGDINTARFYAYNGSLTTPLCAEAVTWIVYSEPLRVPQKLIKRLWDLKGPRHRPLVNNYRSVQKLNGRTVYHRALRF